MRRTLLTLAFCLCLPVTAWALLPDIERGKRAYEQGDLSAAQENLEPLAIRGYVEAQHYLARVHRDQFEATGNDEHRDSAIYWLSRSQVEYPADAYTLARLSYAKTGAPDLLIDARDALKRSLGSEPRKVVPELISLYRDYPALSSEEDLLKLLNRAVRIGDRSSLSAVVSWYESNQDAQANYEQLIALCSRHFRQVPDCLPPLTANARRLKDDALVTRYVTYALDTFPGSDVDARQLDDMASALLDDDIAAPAGHTHAISLLTVAGKHYPRAQARHAGLLLDRPDLASQQDDPVGMLESAYKAGSMDAALSLGRLYMDADFDDAEPDVAERYLVEAASVMSAGKYSLARYLTRGYAGDRYYPKAVELLVDAGRDGYERADYELAQIFSRRVGVEQNLVYAYSFALIARHNDIQQAQGLLNELRAQMTADELSGAKALAQRELDARKARRAPQQLQIADNTKSE